MKNLIVILSVLGLVFLGFAAVSFQRKVDRFKV